MNNRNVKWYLSMSGITLKYGAILYHMLWVVGLICFMLYLVDVVLYFWY